MIFCHVLPVHITKPKTRGTLLRNQGERFTRLVHGRIVAKIDREALLQLIRLRRFTEMLIILVQKSIFKAHKAYYTSTLKYLQRLCFHDNFNSLV